MLSFWLDLYLRTFNHFSFIYQEEIMSFLELAEKRYSVRKFSGKPVEKEKIDLILEAGRLAPTATNCQCQRILVIESPEAVEKLKNCTPCHYNAPAAFLVCCDEQKDWTREADGVKSGVIDASIVATHMMLAATDIGLGSTWVMVFNAEALKNTFKIPEGIVPVALLPVGYPASDSEPSPAHFSRKPINETVRFNQF